jgi:hypothetical protein
MVNLRFAVAAGLEAEAFAPATGDRFLAIAKDLYFPQRNARTVLLLLRRELDAAEYERIAGYFAESAPDTKRDDALLLLACMRERLGGSPAATATATAATTV